MSNRIFLSLAHQSGKEQRYIQEAFSSNWITAGGPIVDAFEKDLATFLEQDVHVAALNSGTSAIHLALILLDIQKNDEVLCQSFTFSASANPILYLGATPIFIDSELETWNLCPIELEKAILDRIELGKKPKAIIAVHLYGVPYQIEAIRSIANQYQIPIIEDSAEACGSAYKNQKCGTFGDLSILSFNGNKIITTSTGGALITKSEKIKQRAIFLATQSRDEAPHYQHSEIGYNYRMSSICAAIGRGQMEVVNNHVALRRKMNNFYFQILDKIAGVTVFQAPNINYFANHWLTCILIDPNLTNGKTREDFRLYLEQQNIESRPLWKPLHLQPLFSHFPYYGSTISENLFENGLCLPSSSILNEEDKNRIKTAILFFFKN